MSRLVTATASELAQHQKLFWRYVVKLGRECWIWTGCVTAPDSPDNGYGVFYTPRGPNCRGRMRAHRAAWILTHGAIRGGMMVCHKCDNRLCVNPAHLFLGTHDDNMRDKAQKGHNVRFPGEKNPNSRLSTNDVMRIRKARAAGTSAKALGARFKVHSGTIDAICARRIWKHV